MAYVRAKFIADGVGRLCDSIGKGALELDYFIVDATLEKLAELDQIGDALDGVLRIIEFGCAEIIDDFLKSVN